MDGNPASLSEWTAIFTCAVIGTHLLVNTAIVISWPNDWPLSVWDMVAALSASALVALIVGILTIAISWETSQHFGRLSADEMAHQLQESLASTLGNANEFFAATINCLQYAESKAGSIVLIALPEGLIEKRAISAELELANLLQKRFAENRPISLTLPNYDQPRGTIWNRIGQIAKDSSSFREHFTNRHAIVTTVPAISDAIVVVLTPSGKPNEFNIGKSALAFPVSVGGVSDYAGIRSEVDRAFGQMVLERFCALVQEPSAPYSEQVLSATDMLAGVYTGVPVTRSIITSQLIQAAETVQDLDTATDYTIKILSPLDPQKTIQFSYSTGCFCPPLHSGQDHSGYVITTVLSNGALPVAGATVWEVGCGPGYVTLLLADRVGPDGMVIATDINEDASRVAKKNIANADWNDRVTFITGDCRNFVLQPDPADADRTVLQAPNGINHHIDMIFIELPLLPYRGKRQLSASEQGYFEAVPAGYNRMLPPSIVQLLEIVQNGHGNLLKIILPIAGGHAEVAAAIREVLSILGSGWQVSEVRSATSGFIVPLLIQFEAKS